MCVCTSTQQWENTKHNARWWTSCDDIFIFLIGRRLKGIFQQWVTSYSACSGADLSGNNSSISFLEKIFFRSSHVEAEDKFQTPATLLTYYASSWRVFYSFSLLQQGLNCLSDRKWIVVGHFSMCAEMCASVCLWEALTSFGVSETKKEETIVTL